MLDLAPLDRSVQEAITTGVFPGACYAVGFKDEVHVRPFGHFMYCPESDVVKPRTLWDLASLSKVVGCTSAAMLLYDDGKLTLDQRVADVIPEFAAEGKDKVTVRNLLLHNSGLPAGIAYHRKTPLPSADESMRMLYAVKLAYPTGTKTVYSDCSMVTLAAVIERLAGKRLDVLLKERLFEPLGLKDTMYRPDGDDRLRCAPTDEIAEWRRKVREVRHEEWKPEGARCHPDQHLYVQGEVHDPTAFMVGGITGNAGLFSSAPDLARFATFMLDKGTYEGRQIISAGTIDRFTGKQDDGSSRALGWDTKGPKSSAGRRFSEHSFGHTGYTGTSIWIDPANRMFAVLLSNRVHPTSANEKLIPYRRTFHDTFAECCGITAPATEPTTAPA
jgi:CubicO group peptidase (beta-lactamase class C family)